MERKLAVILAADVVGFSRLMEVDEERTHAAFNTCNTAIAGLVSKHSGRIFAVAGDSFLAEFASPVEAMRAAIEFQEDVSGCEFRGNPPPHSEMMPPPNSEN
jgi:LysR family glycine cleavage system transcriptional activator